MFFLLLLIEQLMDFLRQPILPQGGHTPLTQPHCRPYLVGLDCFQQNHFLPDTGETWGFPELSPPAAKMLRKDTKAGDYFDRAYGPNDPNTGTIYNNIGLCYHYMQRFDEAIENYKRPFRSVR